jgi:CheY-like chemotaxis protein
MAAIGQSPPAPALASEAPHLCIRPSVLVVDDEAAIRFLLSVGLAPEGYDVLTAANGAEALATVQDAAQRGDTIDAIVLDLQMPVLTGIEFVRAYHELRCCHAPVLLFSADPGAHALAAPLRIDAVLSKPAN